MTNESNADGVIDKVRTAFKDNYILFKHEIRNENNNRDKQSRYQPFCRVY